MADETVSRFTDLEPDRRDPRARDLETRLRALGWQRTERGGDGFGDVQPRYHLRLPLDGRAEDEVRRGERLGYRQSRSAHDGWLVVVSGGTAHGVGLEAPRTLRGLAPRARALVRYSLAAANLVRSPFTWNGRKQWFAEPPHMLVSMLFLPRRVEPPWPGAELAADLRYTATHFDRVVAY